ncbi:Transcription factor bHLH112 [Dichanthelium oligosanthes]|uniref:Transcription factor bHLH112 n=1 Tax=Dichanthelium oligosanthes TaxID=888268 RepID=A0A1E5WFC4_9POAL|nr:Transcription factor bHLH112 [Dichanthelium oligosanthes]
MADEWWSSAARTDDGASACSTVRATTDQDAAESAATSATSTDYFRPSLHGDAAASSTSFLADPPHMDWTHAYMGGRAAAAEATTGFNALLQLHGDAGRRFLLDQPGVVDGAALVAPAAASQGASLYAGNQYSSYGDAVPAAPMTKPFSQQQFSGTFGSSTRNFSGMPPSVPPMTTKPLLLKALEHKAFKSHKEPVLDACSSATRRNVPDSPAAAAKKPRIATPSPLPTFKVRKEKLGDRITALQQLVSPFGKTDTASVLHEAIEYIRFLHDQVAVIAQSVLLELMNRPLQSLSSPYLRCGRPVQVQQLQQQQFSPSYQAKAGDGGEAKEDLRSRGLCLVPVASTYAVASETAPEFWHPTLGGTFR